MIEAHQGEVDLQHSFEAVYNWLKREGEIALQTRVGTRFEARAVVTNRGPHSGEETIRILQRGMESARVYKCCWGHYYNCNRTRIGMYCQALDAQLIPRV